ncbi:MAG TPA: 5-formyltetrahydrofolate cyclo-ligase [Candidatus Dojkabacteria bacterium]|nr:5-formyltetrahydrofolate cyclo-ligase [Candidatus Dojkabacteria bacterium]HRP36331.1 5-formyltetrahydrofolate cyclo-ligase [Candidatus Dojkabacteria bacterium]HRP51030.1 5-formyltetrahydrofolate cyclo-ligase [Candidatus Dojkabacteria bacterium]
MKKSHKHSKIISDNPDTDVTLLKNQLRQSLLDIRSDIPNKADKSKSIVNTILQLQELVSAKTVLLYYPTKQEVDISALFQILQEKGKVIFLPKVKNHKIAKFSAGTPLTKKDKGIYEPDIRVNRNPEKVDVGIIPGLGFDSQGNRIGHGGGWYDRIFHEIKFIYIIGVCFDSQIISKVPTETHDKSVDVVITEKRIINTRY